jgi:hypothetical protein
MLETDGDKKTLRAFRLAAHFQKYLAIPRPYFLGLADEAAVFCFFFWLAAAACEAFCDDFFCTDFGDLSPMIIYLSLVG